MRDLLYGCRCCFASTRSCQCRVGVRDEMDIHYVALQTVEQYRAVHVVLELESVIEVCKRWLGGGGCSEVSPVEDKTICSVAGLAGFLGIGYNLVSSSSRPYSGSVNCRPNGRTNMSFTGTTHQFFRPTSDRELRKRCEKTHRSHATKALLKQRCLCFNRSSAY